jgi:hypothetical protein
MTYLFCYTHCMLTVKNKKYLRFTKIAVIAYLLVGLVLFAVPMLNKPHSPASSNTPSSNDLFATQREDIGRWPVYRYADFKERVANPHYMASDIRIESGDKVSAVVGKGDSRTVLVAENVPKSQAQQELTQFGAVTDNSQGVLNRQPQTLFLNLLTVALASMPFVIAVFLYRAYRG